MGKWKQDWIRDYTFHYMEMFLHVFKVKGKEFYSFKEYILAKKGNLFSFNLTSEEREGYHKHLLEYYLQDTKHLKRLLDTFLSFGEKYHNIAKEATKKDMKSYSNQELVSILKEYYQVWIKFTLYLWDVYSVGEAYIPIVTEHISKKARQLGMEKKLDEYIAYFSYPSKKSSILLLQEHISKLKADNKEIDIEEVYEEYKWMPWGDLHSKPWTIEDVKEYVSQHTESQQNLITFKVMKKELQLNEKEIEMVNMAKDVAYLRDYRDDVRRRTVYLIHFVYEEVASRSGVEYSDLMFYSTPESYELLDSKKLSSSELDKRKGDCVINLVDDKLNVISGNDAKEYFNKIEDETGEEIKGLTASKGKVKGKVCVIRLDSELDKMKKGDIMVAVTTHPQYVTKMQTAKAIVTDEGGITCHAAIVARELSVPCIVGTKNATKVLKDGDMVEVDADKGVVKVE